MKLEETFIGFNIYSAENLGDFNTEKEWVLSGERGVLIRIPGKMHVQAHLDDITGGSFKVILNDFELANVRRRMGAYRVRDMDLQGIMIQDEIQFKSVLGYNTRIQGEALIEQNLVDGTMRKTFVPFDLPFTPDSLFVLPGIDVNNIAFYKRRFTDSFKLVSFEGIESTNLSPEQFEMFCNRRIAEKAGLYQSK